MSETAARPKLGLPTKISYGLGSVAQGVGGVALATATINFYLVAVVGLRPAVVGVVILVSLVIDAVVDPLIGRWSDTFRSPWGRRHPFMYASALPIALGIMFLWRHPAWVPNSLMVFYALGVLILVRLCGGLYQIPSDALAPELAPDYYERTGLISWRWFFGLIGAIVMGFLAGVVFLRKDKLHPLGPLDPAGYANFGVAAAVVVLVAILVSSLATHRYIPQLNRPPVRRQTATQSIREVIAILANPSLIAVIVSGVVSGVASGIGSATSTFMNYYFWGLTPQTASWIGLMAAPAAVIGVILAPFVSRVLDKKRTMITVFALSVFAGVVPVSLRLLGLAPPNGSVWIPVILVADLIVAGTLGIMGFIIVSSMMADVVEDSAVKTGVRSEGLIFATNGLLPKITAGLGGLVGNLILEFVRFPVGAQIGKTGTVDPEIMRHLALLTLPAGAVLNLIAIGVLVFYRLDRTSHERNLVTLRESAALADAALEINPSGGQPFTGVTIETAPPVL